MTPQTLTLIFIGLVALIAVPAYDIWAFTNTHTGDTISNVMRSLASYLPILPFWWGVAGGHLFATAPPALDPGARIALLVWLSATIMLLCHANVLNVARRWDVAGLLMLGVLIGALLLSQRHAYTL